ncbi:mucin-20-like [Pyrus x bretschneideri]|uniref:mucin-20-like n=1 Tax=Pyrus x bretschneideri TaxID=225117 RepID=UPI00202FB560|nr:mucin-20-like [Pyrus x bretschneideri]
MTNFNHIIAPPGALPKTASNPNPLSQRPASKTTTPTPPTTLSTPSPSKNSTPSAPSSTPTCFTPSIYRNSTSPLSSDGSTATLSSTERPLSSHVSQEVTGVRDWDREDKGDLENDGCAEVRRDLGIWGLRAESERESIE